MKKQLKRLLSVLMTVMILMGVVPLAGMFNVDLGAAKVFAAGSSVTNETIIGKRICKFNNFYFAVEGQYVYRYDLNLSNKTRVQYKGQEHYNYTTLNVYRGNLYLAGGTNCSVMKYNLESNSLEKIYDSSNEYKYEIDLEFYKDYMIIQDNEMIFLLNLTSGVIVRSFEGRFLSVSGSKVIYQSKDYVSYYLYLRENDIETNNTTTLWAKKCSKESFDENSIYSNNIYAAEYYN